MSNSPTARPPAARSPAAGPPADVPSGAGRWASHPGQRLTIMLGVRDHLHRCSLVIETLRAARRANLAEATVFQAGEGYGSSGRIHPTHLLSEDASLSVVIVDRPERIGAFVESNAKLLGNLLMTMDDVDVVDV